jgi:hypothetical protein
MDNVLTLVNKALVGKLEYLKMTKMEMKSWV